MSDNENKEDVGTPHAGFTQGDGTAPEAAPVAEPTDAVAAALEETKDTEVTVVALPNRDIKPGMVVRVHEIIKDLNAKGEERERVQVFEGMVLGVSGAGIQRTMTVRKVSGGIGVEKIYPLSSPHVQKIEVVKQYRTRRSKLWFLRRGFKRRLQEVV